MSLLIEPSTGFETIRYAAGELEILDQTVLPRRRETRLLHALEDVAVAIETMQVRGAPLIGVTAAYGVVLALARDSSDAALEHALSRLLHTRPTAVNLAWALDRMRAALVPLPAEARFGEAELLAAAIKSHETVLTETIGNHGLEVFKSRLSALGTQRPLQIMTHCNAGKLGTPGLGTATAPMYLAHRAGLPIHVWVSETRPRWQGALTAWELAQEGVPHTVISDNAAGHLLQRGLVDLVLVGADRVTRRGDVANKIGTYLKAVAAQVHEVPFYVAFATNTLDLALDDGLAIPIEERSEKEVLEVGGYSPFAEGTRARNDAFDVTPARWITGYITERGVLNAAELAVIVAETAPHE
jgi:methylthioribose-1-phosphate isomerase